MKAAHKLRARFMRDRNEALRMARMCRDTCGSSHSIVRDWVKAARQSQSQALKISKGVL